MGKESVKVETVDCGDVVKLLFDSVDDVKVFCDGNMRRVFFTVKDYRRYVLDYMLEVGKHSQHDLPCYRLYVKRRGLFGLRNRYRLLRSRVYVPTSLKPYMELFEDGVRQVLDDEIDFSALKAETLKVVRVQHRVNKKFLRKMFKK